MANQEDRRTFVRMTVNRPVKIRFPEGGRYWAGITRNISTGGALLEVDYPGRLLPGQRLRLAVTDDQRQVIVASKDMANATVVRNLGHDGRQQVALRFDELQAAQAAA